MSIGSEAKPRTEYMIKRIFEAYGKDLIHEIYCIMEIF